MMYKSTDHGSDVKILFHSQTAQKHSASLRSSIHSLRIRMTSYPCNKYEQITPSYLLSVNHIQYMSVYQIPKICQLEAAHFGNHRQCVQ